MSFRKQKQQRIAARIELTGKADLPIIGDADYQEMTVSVDRHGLVQSSFKDDVKILKKLETIDEKVEFKRDILIPRYIDAALNMVKIGDVSNGSILFDLAVWCLDVGDIDNATTLTVFVLENEIDSPHWYESSAATFLADSFLKWISPKTKFCQSAEPYITTWVGAYSKLSEAQMDELHNIPHASLIVHAGKQAHIAKDYKKAIKFYEASKVINPRSGVKGVLKSAEEEKPLEPPKQK